MSSTRIRETTLDASAGTAIAGADALVEVVAAVELLRADSGEVLIADVRSPAKATRAMRVKANATHREGFCSTGPPLR
jgi:hypothetical protein